MTITAEVIEDSISLAGIRLTTMQIKYPRMIHSEFMTHRVFSRNASSSRAIPILVMLRNTAADMAEPSQWGSNKPGMQAGKNLIGWRLKLARMLWRSAGHTAIFFARRLAKTGAHKQIANRIVEPWSHISVVVTSTDWANWFALRDHPDADPTIQELARAMSLAMEESSPMSLLKGQWHLPYISSNERKVFDNRTLARWSAARCARVSYLTHDGKTPSALNDERLWVQLVESQPVHASPTEHQAAPDPLYVQSKRNGNFRGWRQHRKMISGEAIHD
jgi:hypothetical protein